MAILTEKFSFQLLMRRNANKGNRVGFYSNYIFPRLYNCVIDKPHWSQHREEQLATVEGEILEIGIGTGLNLPHYPSHVKKITTVDPHPGMNQQLQYQIQQSNIEVHQQLISCESLPFEDATFDSIVSTITLCSVADVNSAVNELYRVLKPGGRVLFLEHGLSPETKVAKWQNRINWLEGMIGDGCTLTLNLRDLFTTLPFSKIEIDNFYMEKTPKTHGYMYRGVATK